MINNISLHIADSREQYENPEIRILSRSDPHIWKDCSLAAGIHYNTRLQKNHYHLFIPIYGDLQIYSDNQIIQINIGQVLLLSTDHTTKLDLMNVEAQEKTNFIHLIIPKEDKTEAIAPWQEIYTIQLSDTPNSWLKAEFTQPIPFAISLGAFYSGQTFNYDVNVFFSNHLISVIDGALEIEERIVYDGDMLHIRELLQLEIESLTPYTVGIMLEW
ncbi:MULTISPECIES: hypothetical protein [unclassified Sphingobacterium]|uniref:hypothetical protein n=1 Tax=unclassified Sphingobacterium TaxID=2609468 RepID=UPI0025CCED12|nr:MULTISPECIES: hypothetical protein [unclassified Sphingobacterium]